MRVRAWIAGAALAALVAGTAHARAALTDDFRGPDGLITNERVEHDERSEAPRSPTWRVTSGSLFRRGGWGWTGVPDATSPDVCSCRSTGSAIFRMVNRGPVFGDVSFRLRVRNLRFVSSRAAPARATDGLHLMLRWRSERETYYVTIDRRDGRATIKRKTPGGPSNGGTYVTLAERALGRVPLGRVRRVRADARNVGRTVRLSLWIDGRVVLRAVDRGQGPGGPLLAPGRVGIRADNDEVLFDDVRVVPLR